MLRPIAGTNSGIRLFCAPIYMIFKMGVYAGLHTLAWRFDSWAYKVQIVTFSFSFIFNPLSVACISMNQ